MAAQIRVPHSCLAFKGCLGEFEEGCLELGNVVVKVGRAFPKEAAKLPDRLLLAFLTQVDVDSNGGLQGVTINRLHIAVACNLICDCALEFIFHADNDSDFKLVLACLTETFQVVTLDEVDIKIVEESVEEHGKDGVVIPLLHEPQQKVFTKLPGQTRFYLLCEVFCNDSFVHLMHHVAFVMDIALLIDS